MLHELRYPLRNASGKLVAEHIRREGANGEKSFSWCVPGQGREGLHGLRKIDLPLYGTELLSKAPTTVPVIVTEGEKAADTLRQIVASEVIVLGTATGAGSCPSVEALAPLAGREVFLWPDNDPEGQKHMVKVAGSLAKLGVNARRLVWGGAQEKGDDAADFVARGGKIDGLRALLGTAAPTDYIREAKVHEPEPILTRLSTVAPKTVLWLWGGRIPLGKLTVLDGDPGLGKSLVTLDIAARVSRGTGMPEGGGSDLTGPADVVLMTFEDDPADTIRPRLDAAGADVDRVHVLEGVSLRETKADGSDHERHRLPNLADLEVIRKAVSEVGAKLVVVDPFMAALAGVDAHSDAEIRELLTPLSTLAEETGVAVVLVRHLRKSGGSNPIYAGGGSIGIIGAARSGLMIARDPDDSEGRRCVLATTKSNLAREAVSLAYVVEPTDGDVPRIRWAGEVGHTATTLMQASVQDDGQRSALSEAESFLRGALRPGPRPVNDLRREVDQAGLKWRTIERAKATLGVQAVKAEFSGGWIWRMPGPGEGVPIGGLRMDGGLGQEGVGESPLMDDQGTTCPLSGDPFPIGEAVSEMTKTAKLTKAANAQVLDAEPCFVCRERQRWRRDGGPARCPTCQPPPPGIQVELVYPDLKGAGEGDPT